MPEVGLEPDSRPWRSAAPPKTSAFAGESSYGDMLHTALAGENIHVAQLIIPGAIEAGDPTNDPAVIARTLWDIHTKQGEYRRFTKPLD